MFLMSVNMKKLIEKYLKTILNIDY